MLPRLNHRLLWLTLLLALFAGGLWGGATWWRGRPEYLHGSAQKYFATAEEARRRGDRNTARTYYQYADQQLRNLLDRGKAPDHRPGLLLRHKALFQLAMILRAEEEERGQRGPDLPSGRAAAEAKRLAFRAAADPDFFDAQTSALDYCFRDDELHLAPPYAANVLKRSPGEDPGLDDYFAGAHFALAWEAMASRPPRPVAALEHLRANAELQKRRAGPGEEPPPRWRDLDLEVRARQVKLDQLREAVRPGVRPAPAAAKLPETLASFHALLEQGVERARREKGQVVPATAGRPAAPALATLGRTDMRGLYRFLTLAVAEARSRDEVLDRASLMVEVCTASVAAGAREHALAETLPAAARLLGVLGKLPTSRRPAAADLAGVNRAIEAILARAAEKHLPIDPGLYRDLADSARAAGNRSESLRLALRGLELAERKPGAGGPVALELHARAAWLLLLEERYREAEEHLAPLRKDRAFADKAHLIQGLAAVRDGRLDEGVRELLQARHNPRVGQTILPYPALAVAYMGLGRYPEALAVLKRLEAFYQKFGTLGDEERRLAEQFVPEPGALRLELLRCHLRLGQWDEADEYHKKLQDQPQGAAADALMARALQDAGRDQRRAGRDDLAGEHFGSARKLLDEARKLHPTDIDLAVAEVNLILNEPAPPSAVGLALGGPARLNHLMQRARAEAFLSDFVTRRKDLAARLLWSHWLQATGRTDDALALLVSLEKDFPGHRQRLQVERAQLLLSRRRADEVGRLVRELEAEGADLAADFLQLASYFSTGDLRSAEERLTAALARNEHNGQLHFWHGQLAQARGDFGQAAWSYGRSLPFTRFKARSRQGLLACLLGLARKETPAAARDLAARLLQAHPDDPALLVAYARLAMLLDDLYGSKGMEGALAALRGALEKEQQDPASAPYLAALCWRDAGRPDRARQQAEAALRANGSHVPSLLLAGQLARDAGDWESCLRHAAALEEARPDAVEVSLWRAAALLGQGDRPQARDIYRSLVRKHPGHPAGYEGLTRLREQDGDRAGALKWANAWIKAAPADLSALRVRTRLLAPDDLRKAETLPEDRTDGKLFAVLAVARGLQDAGLFERSRRWLARAEELARKRADAFQAVRLQLADSYMKEGQAMKDASRRRALMDRAIEQYQAAYRADPGNRVAANNLAWLLHSERGDSRAALAVLEELRKGCYSGKPVGGERLPLEVLDTLGVVYRACGQHERAVRLFREARQRYPEEPQVHLHLARSLAGLGKTREAFESFSRSVKLAYARIERSADDRQKGRLRQLVAEALREQEQLPPVRR